MTKRVSLSVNDAPIEMDYFVQGFIDHTIEGIIESLEEAGPIKTLNMSIEGDKAAINLNGTAVSANPFVSKIIASTVNGMVSSLKGVSKIKKVKVVIEK